MLSALEYEASLYFCLFVKDTIIWLAAIRCDVEIESLILGY